MIVIVITSVFMIISFYSNAATWLVRYSNSFDAAEFFSSPLLSPVILHYFHRKKSRFVLSAVLAGWKIIFLPANNPFFLVHSKCNVILVLRFFFASRLFLSTKSQII